MNIELTHNKEIGLEELKKLLDTYFLNIFWNEGEVELELEKVKFIFKELEDK